MKSIILISLFTLITACGNPHISSVRDGIETIISPTEDECDELEGITSNETEFNEIADCRDPDTTGGAAGGSTGGGTTGGGQQQQDDQEQSETVDGPKVTMKWRFRKSLTHFGVKIPEVVSSANVKAFDCSGEILAEDELSPGSVFLGVVVAKQKICELNLTYDR